MVGAFVLMHNCHFFPICPYIGGHLAFCFKLNFKYVYYLQ